MVFHFFIPILYILYSIKKYCCKVVYLCFFVVIECLTSATATPRTVPAGHTGSGRCPSTSLTEGTLFTYSYKTHCGQHYFAIKKIESDTITGKMWLLRIIGIIIKLMLILGQVRSRVKVSYAPQG